MTPALAEALTTPVAFDPAARHVIVYAYDRRSERCRLAESMLAATLQQRRDRERIQLVHLEWSDEPQLARRLGIDAVPSVLVLTRGRVVARLDEAVTSRRLAAFVSRWLGPSERPGDA